jgi:hypothetical protein
MTGVDPPDGAADPNVIDRTGYLAYLERQTRQLEQDAEYPPALYVEQRGVVTGAGADSGPVRVRDRPEKRKPKRTSVISVPLW